MAASPELCCSAGKVSAHGVCLGRVSACVLSAPKGTLRWCKQRMGLGRPQASLGGLRGPTGLGRGGILLFQAIFAALGLCCLGGRDAGSGCCCCWQLLRSSAAGFPWLPNPKPVELSVCTDRGNLAVKGPPWRALEKSLFCFWFLLGCLFLSFIFSLLL